MNTFSLIVIRRFLVAVLMLMLSLGWTMPACAETDAKTLDALLFATRFDDPERMQDLLDQGADPNAREPQRSETLLMVAIREKSDKIVAQLLKHPKISLEAHAGNGDTALMLACFTGDLNAARMLVQAGAEVNQPGWAALHYGAANGSVEILHFLIQQSAYIDAESPNKTTPLMMAVRFGQYDAAAFLISEGADVTLRNEAGFQAADFARETERSDLIGLFAPADSGNK